MASDSGSKRELAGRTVDMLVDVAQQITTLSIGLIVVLAGFLEWRGIQSASGRWIASVVVILFGSCILMALRAQTQFSMVLTYLLEEDKPSELYEGTKTFTRWYNWSVSAFAFGVLGLVVFVVSSLLN